MSDSTEARSKNSWAQQTTLCDSRRVARLNDDECMTVLSVLMYTFDRRLTIANTLSTCRLSRGLCPFYLDHLCLGTGTGHRASLRRKICDLVSCRNQIENGISINEGWKASRANLLAWNCGGIEDSLSVCVAGAYRTRQTR